MRDMAIAILRTANQESIALVRKAKPDWQKGKLNFPGGKVEPEDEDFYATIRRELREETGLDEVPEKLRMFAMIKGDGYRLAVFDVVISEAEMTLIDGYREPGSRESITVMDLGKVQHGYCPDAMPNLSYLISIALEEPVGTRPRKPVVTIDYTAALEDDTKFR